MKRVLSLVTIVAVVVLLAGVAAAWMGPGRMGMGPMGPGMMGGAGPATCPGPMAAAATIDAERATALAEEYAKQYLPGFAVERVLPFAGRHMTMYIAELKGPDGELRILHINPWGTVMPAR